MTNFVAGNVNGRQSAVSVTGLTGSCVARARRGYKRPIVLDFFLSISSIKSLALPHSPLLFQFTLHSSSLLSLSTPQSRLSPHMCDPAHSGNKYSIRWAFNQARSNRNGDFSVSFHHPTPRFIFLLVTNIYGFTSSREVIQVFHPFVGTIGSF